MTSSQSYAANELTERVPEELLGEFPLFASLPLERRAKLGALLKAGRYGPGEKIFAYGDPGDHLFFICRGQVTFSLTDNVDHTQEYGAISAGGCFGEVAVFSGGTRTADGQVVEETRTLELNRRDVEAFFAVCPEAQRLILESMARHLDAASRQNRDHVARISQAIRRQRTSADGRVARLVRVLAAPWFLIAQIAACGLWMAFSQRIDPFPYPFLGFLLGAEALIATFLILRYQNREEESDRVRDAALDRAVDGISQRLDEILKQVKR